MVVLLYYYGARYYDATIGRFISVDPWEGDLKDPQSLNKYSYVVNNPLKYVDPSGEKVELVAKSILWGFGVHTFLRITPDNPGDFGMDEDFTFTVGGYTKGGRLGIKNLEARINSPSDTINLDQNDILETQIVDSPKGRSDTNFITDIMSVYGGYDNENKEPYSPFAVDGEYNCNTFTNSLLEATGAGGIPEGYNPLGANPGVDKTIPSVVNNPTSNINWVEEFDEKVRKLDLE